jgi:hypothetical protein
MSRFEFTARFDGICDGCEEEIFPGQKIVATEGVFSHSECVSIEVVWQTEVRDDEPVAPLARPLCRKCFVELPVSGICGFCS